MGTRVIKAKYVIVVEVYCLDRKEYNVYYSNEYNYYEYFKPFKIGAPKVDREFVDRVATKPEDINQLNMAGHKKYLLIETEDHEVQIIGL